MERVVKKDSLFVSLLLSIPILFYFAIALYHLNCLPIWIDEAIAIFPAKAVAEKGYPQAYFDLDFVPWQIRDGIWDPATPFYRYLLGGFFALVGFNEFTARLFSVLFGAFVIVLLTFFFRYLYPGRGFLLIPYLVVFSPTFISFSREARHFTLLMFLGTASLFSLVLGMEKKRSFLLLSFLLTVLTLLTQTLGTVYFLVYLLSFLVGLLYKKISLTKREKLFGVLLLLAFLLYESFYGRTHPLFHELSCKTRPFDCKKEGNFYFYLLTFVLSGFSTGDTNLAIVYKFPPVFSFSFLIVSAGLGVAVFSLLRRFYPFFVLLLSGIVPVAVLSFREIKYERYLLETTLPSLFLLEGLGILFFGRILGSFLSSSFLKFLFFLYLLRPFFGVSPSALGYGSKVVPYLGSAFEEYLRYEILNTPMDNFELMRKYVEFLEKRVRKGKDIVVTTFNDPALSYYLDYKVYGWITSRRTDEEFVSFFSSVEKKNGVLYLVMQGPFGPFCYEDPPASTKPIPCEKKFKRFVEECERRKGKECFLVAAPFNPREIPRYEYPSFFCPWVKKP